MAKLTFGHLMGKIYKLSFIKNTRLYIQYGLVFFLFMIFYCCKDHSQKVTLLWKDHRAMAIQIPAYLTKDISTHPLKVILAIGKEQKGILGDFADDGDIVLFKPLIPLSPGLTYKLLQNKRVIGNISVPFDKDEQPPVLIAIYPEKDTLPENLLKFYFRFSKPMQTDQSLNYICLLDEHEDTMRNVFLNLQPELWDTTGTVLTLWLDPGRIKRGLVLNRKLGNPLKKSETYELVLSEQWKDSHALKLSKSYTKQFVVAARDSQIPDVAQWELNNPKAGTTTPLIINVKEPLDHYLLQESIRVVDSSRKAVKGTIEISEKDQIWKFTPSSPWRPSGYKLRVKANLEDLTGNNLNRVFDRDITKEMRKDNEYYEKEFKVKL
jgi:hypothetical protein